MTWSVATPKSYSGGPAIAPDAIHLSTKQKPKPKAGDQHTMFVHLEIGSDIVRRMGWQDGDRLELAWGQAEHRGQLRLRKAPDHAPAHTLRRNKRGVYRLTTSSVPADFSDKRFKRQRCALEILEGKSTEPSYVVVDLPRGFLAGAFKRQKAEA
jgi:hypothetical protein